MPLRLLRRLVGSRNSRVLQRHGRVVTQINALEDALCTQSEGALRESCAVLRRRATEGGESLDVLLPELFALVREAGRRTLELRHFDVQLLGGIVLHEGNIAEMATGEGKTLVATLALCLRALSGGGVHLVTVNDYLAERDALWMAPLYKCLGFSVGMVLNGGDTESKRAAYAADICYGTNHEFGFDYLRDNMSFSLEDKVQQGREFAIVDEVDSILIDEARTPLIISGASEQSSELYRRIQQMIPLITADSRECYFMIDEKKRQVELSEEGHEFAEDWLERQGLLQPGESLYAAANLLLLHHILAALRAHTLYRRDTEYITQDGQVVLIDEHTGRTMPGRRLSDGLHQALEAKEGLSIQRENQTLASTTYQNYFRLYGTLAGMTGTADTEAAEFHQIYGLEVVVVPTNQTVRREDENDLIYLSEDEKHEALVADIRDLVDAGAPVLVGTTSIDNSERVSQLLKQEGVAHNVLNAKQHQREAEVIAQAGRPGTVTIATNMAGRGTDIVLGGNLEVELAALSESEADNAERQASLRTDWDQRHQQVIDAGGLHVLGTGRHESRRVDNQLRGRSGRQGDPGLSRFYLSLDDELMRIFLSDSIKNFMSNLGLAHGESIEHRMVTRAIRQAQRRVESHNFDMRKQLLEYDDIADTQRKVIYGQREMLLCADDIAGAVQEILHEVLKQTIEAHLPPDSLAEQWDVPGLEQALSVELNLSLPLVSWLEEDDELYEDTLRERIEESLDSTWREREQNMGATELRRLERLLMLQVLDMCWKQHLGAMDHLRQGIHLRAYAQRNPKEEYKREAFLLFQKTLWEVKRRLVHTLMYLPVDEGGESAEEVALRQRREHHRKLQRLRFGMGAAPPAAAPPAVAAASGSGEGRPASEPAPEHSAPQAPPPIPPMRREFPKVGRNDPCPCGSKRKYKHCHGR